MCLVPFSTDCILLVRLFYSLPFIIHFVLIYPFSAFFSNKTRTTPLTDWVCLFERGSSTCSRSHSYILTIFNFQCTYSHWPTVILQFIRIMHSSICAVAVHVGIAVCGESLFLHGALPSHSCQLFVLPKSRLFVSFARNLFSSLSHGKQ